MTPEELKKILDNPKGQLIAVDLDGTLCDGAWWKEECTPRPEMIEKVWKLYISGAHIIIYTARQPKYYALTHGWLVRHEVPFHGITMCMKPGAAVYIDDRALNVADL